VGAGLFRGGYGCRRASVSQADEKSVNEKAIKKIKRRYLEKS
jgi:hypothetical protein